MVSKKVVIKGKQEREKIGYKKVGMNKLAMKGRKLSIEKARKKPSQNKTLPGKLGKMLAKKGAKAMKSVKTTSGTNRKAEVLTKYIVWTRIKKIYYSRQSQGIY